MSSMRMGWLATCICVLTACGDSTPAASNDAATNTDAVANNDANPAVCRRAFEATVRNGPDANAAVMGTLVLTQTSATTVTGYVDPGAPDDGGTLPASVIRQRVPVTGTIAGNQLTMTFTLPDGRTMQGTGTLPSSGWSCPNELTGGLTGPGAGDTGDWRVTVTVRVCTTILGVEVCVTARLDL